MQSPISLRLIDSQSPTWRDDLHNLIPSGAPIDLALHLPLHFCQVTIPRLKGYAYQILRAADGQVIAYGYLLPRTRLENGTRVFTIRHHTSPGEQPQPNGLIEALFAAESLAADQPTQFVFYRPESDHIFDESHQLLGPVDIGKPSAEEAAQIPKIHQQVWGSAPDALYPADLASEDCAAGSALVARVDGKLVGFLIGFTKFAENNLPLDWQARLDGELRLESQIMGVLPDYRGLRIASLLKRVQAEQAQAAGIRLVNWTVDPLQYPNAALNFGLLRAVAFDFYPDLYPFRNNLNRVAASRLGITWLIDSERVQSLPIIGARATVIDLATYREIPLANDATTRLEIDPDATIVAIEIPSEWTRLQADDETLARRWRATTDALFAQLLGRTPDKHCITGVAVRADRRYLLAERSTEALWRHLIAS